MIWHHSKNEKCPSAGATFWKSNVVEECKKYCDVLRECNVILTNGVECVVRKCKTPVPKPQTSAETEGIKWGPYPNDDYKGINGTLGYFPWIQGYCKNCYFAPENLKEALASMSWKTSNMRTYKLIDMRIVYSLS